MKPISDVGSVRGPFRCQRVDASNSLLIFFVFLLLIMNSNLQNLLITHILNIVLRHTCKTNKILNKIHQGDGTLQQQTTLKRKQKKQKKRLVKLERNQRKNKAFRNAWKFQTACHCNVHDFVVCTDNFPIYSNTKFFLKQKILQNVHL